MCCLCLCNLRSSTLELTLQNFVNLCNQWPPKGIRMHQIRFAPGLRPGPRWGSSRRSPRPLVGWGGGYPPHAPRRLWRLDLGACWFVPNLFFVLARLVSIPTQNMSQLNCVPCKFCASLPQLWVLRHPNKHGAYAELAEVNVIMPPPLG